MDRLKGYILSKFIKNFFTLFLPFFILMSAIYIVGISRISAKINLSAQDFFTLYLYTLPEILSSAIPIAFFGAVINSFASLSSNSEITAIFSIGYSPIRFVKYLFPVAFLITIFLLFLTLAIKPITAQKINIFKAKKIYEEKLKILPNRLSQKYGNQHIFIEKGDENNFKNITLFSKEDNFIQIMIAKDGSIVNKKPQAYLNLNNGLLFKSNQNSYTFVNFKNLKLFNTQDASIPTFQSIKRYWHGREKPMQYHIFISISPVILLLALIALGIYNNRYEKNLSSLYIFIIAIIIYMMALFIRRNGDIKYIIIFTIISSLVSFYIFRNRVLRRY